MARGEYSTAEAKEKLEQEILNVQIQAVQEGKEFNLKYLKEKIDKTKYEITLDDEENPTTAVIKEIGSNYYLTVDSKLKVTKVEEKAPKPQHVKFSKLTWASGKASVELSTKEAGTIEYKVGKDGIYQAGTTISNLNNGDIMYVRVNNNGTYTDEETLEIKDTIEPEEFTITASDITYEGVKLTGSTQDLQTGIKDYTYVAETKTNEIVKEIANQTATEYTITGLDPETEYVVYMLAYDNAGNVRKSNEVTVTTTKMPSTGLYGKKVNYIANQIDDWKVFYVDDTNDNIYIITSEYVPTAKITEELVNAEMTIYPGTEYGMYWKGLPKKKSLNYIELNKKFMVTNYGEAPVEVIQSLVDTSIWSRFAVGKSNELEIEGAEAIASPTKKMWATSWDNFMDYNKVDTKYKSLYKENENARTEKLGSSLSTFNDAVKELKLDLSVYFPQQYGKNFDSAGYILSTRSTIDPYGGPKGSNIGHVWEKGVTYSPNVGSNYGYNNQDMYTVRASLRPVVCIPGERYKLQLNSEKTMCDIVEKE